MHTIDYAIKKKNTHVDSLKMAGDITETGAQFSRGVGLIYIFNLIVGTGALTMPKAFSTAGWLLSLITVSVLAFVSFITVTFVTEVMGYANAKLRQTTRCMPPVNEDESEPSPEEGERRPLLPEGDRNVGILYSRQQGSSAGMSAPVEERPHSHSTRAPYLYSEKEESSDACNISARIELGQMASMFFNKMGLLMFYVCVVLYLYGDLAIYCAAVPVSLRDVICTYTLPKNVSCVGNHTRALSDSDICWPNKDISRLNAYRICVALFFATLGPFVFFNVQKTKYLQLFTTVTRWLAFLIMIILASIRLQKKEGEGHPPVADFSGVPNLFGVCVYSFMCHHSLPSLITPINNKNGLYRLVALDFSLILGFYALVSFTGIFAFASLNDLYTLNFLPDECDSDNAITKVAVIQYFLALFPVFTLSTNFPIISITLRNNLKTLFYRKEKPFSWFVDRIVFPLCAIIPPFAVAFATNQVEFLVGITGSYAGVGIQYVIPAALVLFARKQMQKTSPGLHNRHTSPFRHTAWVIAVITWAAMSIILVTVNHIITGE